MRNVSTRVPQFRRTRAAVLFLGLLLGTCLQLGCASNHCTEDNCQSAETKAIIKACKMKEALRHNIRMDSNKVSTFFDEDMMMSTSDARQFDRWKECTSNASRRRKRDIQPFASMPERKWPMPIKFKIDGTLNGGQKDKIRQGIKWWTDATCIQFQEVAESTSVNEQHVVFAKGNRCASFVGRNTQVNPQPIFLHPICFSPIGIIAHEIGHCLGMWHEHQRPDRDTYVTIAMQNVQPGLDGSFIKVPASMIQSTFNGVAVGYDLASIMHYPKDAFTSSADKNTILTVDPLYEQTIGQRAYLSFLDVKIANLAYCSGKCSNRLTKPCQNGGYQDPKKCQACRCPDGLTGTYCDSVLTTAKCGGKLTATSTDQEITSPGYISPGNYFAGDKCSWQIEAPPGYQIQLSFSGSGTNDFGVYMLPNGICYHWVEIRYQGILGGVGPRFCSKKRPTQVLTSTGNKVLIDFRSPFQFVGTSDMRGFKLKYKSVNFRCNTNPCLNGGTCNAGGGPTCTCKPGFTGHLCETDVDNCAPNPCKNGAQCVDGVDSYTCNCKPGYVGTNCETDVDNCAPNPCKNGAQCVDGVDSYTCNCRPGYVGTNCETDKNECSSNPCQNGGRCEDQVNSYQCRCQNGFSGVNCQTPPNHCIPNPCENGGICQHSRRFTFICTCRVGWQGKTCNERKWCYSNPCKNGGICRETGNGYMCICMGGFTGNQCQVRPTTAPPTNPCSGSPCQNGGTCLAMGNRYKCRCHKSYTGNRCQIKVTCGGIGRRPGSLAKPCVQAGATEMSTCARQTFHEVCSGRWWWRRCHRVCTTRYYRCRKTKTYCTGSAIKLLFSQSHKVLCGVPGWEDNWPHCSTSCGCGVQIKKKWGVRAVRGRHKWGVIQEHIRECHTQPCKSLWRDEPYCKRYSGARMRGGSCQGCINRYRHGHWKK